MINLSWSSHKQPTKKRREASHKARNKTISHKRYLRSVKFCQRCGAEVYPSSEGEYALTKIFDKEKGIELLVCDKCKNKA